MKFFSEFSLCYGGAATVTPAAEYSVVDRPPQEGNGHASARRSGRSTKPNSSSTHWKPALSAISEDSVVVPDRSSGKIERSIGYQKKKAKSTAMATTPNHGDDYRKDSMMVAFLAVSQTPFLF